MKLYNIILLVRTNLKKYKVFINKKKRVDKGLIKLLKQYKYRMKFIMMIMF